MAQRELHLTLSEETLQLIDAEIASGRYADANEFVEAGIDRLRHDMESFDDWIRREAIPALQEIEACPSSALTLEQAFAGLIGNDEKATREQS